MRRCDNMIPVRAPSMLETAQVVRKAGSMSLGMKGDLLERVLRRGPYVAVTIGLMQALLLCIGWIFLYGQTHERVAGSVEELILQANAGAAESIARTLGEFPDNLTSDSDGWQRSQSIIEDVELAAGGFACLLDQDGFIACHPDLRDDPSLREVNLAGHNLSKPQGGGMASIASVGGDGVESGLVDFALGGKHYVSTYKAPNGVQLLVHQPVSGLESASAHATGGIIALTLAIGSVVFGLTTILGIAFFRAHSGEVIRWNETLEHRVQDQTAEIVRTQHGIIFGIAKLAEYRDNETGMHVERMCAYSAILAQEMRRRGAPIDEDWVVQLKLAASLHDIGKVAIPDAILMKPGRLTPAEFDVMKTHAATGCEALVAIRKHVGEDAFLDMGIDISGCHHERWDGNGYPNGLAGEQIPLSARIVAVGDVFDALMSKRVYKPAMSFDETCAIITEGRGAHFDPEVVDAFQAVRSEMLKAQMAMQDVEEIAPVSPHREHSDLGQKIQLT